MTTRKVALYLLLILALAAIPGSVFPQRDASPLKVRDYFAEQPVLAQWLDRFGMFNVYGSPWFSAVYLLLVISLIGCIVPRTPKHLADWRRSPASPPTAARAAEGVALGQVSKPLALAKLSRTRHASGDDWVTIDKGILKESANLLFHASLLGVLLAIAFGSLFGYRGQVIVREGTGFSNVIAQFDSFKAGRLLATDSLTPFHVALDAMEVDFEPTGAASDFRARVTYRDAVSGAAVIGVNSPLDIGGASVFLVGHGYAPVFEVTDVAGNVGFSDSVVCLPQDQQFTSTCVVKVPDLSPQIGVEALFTPTAGTDAGGDFGSAFPSPLDPAMRVSIWRGDLGLNDGVAQNVYQLDKVDLTEVGSNLLRPGETLSVPGVGSVKFVELRRFATFNVGSDPGQSLALGLVLFTILNLTAMLLLRRRQLWLLWDEAGNCRAIALGVNAERDLANLARQLGQ